MYCQYNGTRAFAIISINDQYIVNIMVQEPLLKNNFACKCNFYKYFFIMNSYILFISIIIYLVNNFVLETLQFLLQK